MPLVWGEESWGGFRGTEYRGICPAMKIDKSYVETVEINSVEEIESRVYDSEESQLTGPAVEIYSNKKTVSESWWNTSMIQTWNCIWMGSYPQSEVDEKTKILLDGLVGSDDWDDDNDICLGSNKYRRVLCGTEDEAFYRYFKYEPIKWRIIKTDGNFALVFADKNIETCGYYSVESIKKPWENNSARYFLNNKFY